MNMVDGWKSVTVEECCEILDNKRIPVNGEDRERRIGEVPYYGANGLQGYIDSFIFDEPLILIAEDGGRFDEFATRPIAYRVTGKSWVNNHAHVLRAKEAFCQDAVFYNLEHKDIQSFIVGGTRSKLNQSALRAIILFLPNAKSEQTKIAEVLLAVDHAIEQTETLTAKQQRIKAGLMQDLLTRGIDEHGNLRSEKTHDFKGSPLGRIPVGWEVNLLDCLAIRGSGHTPNKRKPTYWNGGIKWVSLSDSNKLDDVFISETDKEISALGLENSSAVLHPKGTVILSRDAGVGKSAILGEDMAVSQHFMAWRCKPSKLDNGYLYYWLQKDKPKFEGIASGSTIVTIGLQFFRQYQIAAPKLVEEQKHISEILFNMDIAIQRFRTGLIKLYSLKTALMQDLLTGKKRVTPLLEMKGTN